MLGTRRRIVSILVATAFLLAPALALVPGVPTASAEPAVLDTFAGGVSSAELTFGAQPWNTTLALELPRGSQLSTASFSATGIAGPTVIYSVQDFSGLKVGADRWAKHHEGPGIYPPEVDPYKTWWKDVAAADLKNLKADDGAYWYTATPNKTAIPPWEWPIQLYHFDPDVPGAPAYRLVWNGYSVCNVNKTDTYHAEMWLYDHVDEEWVMVGDYSANVGGDEWINVTVAAGSKFQATNGSIPIAIVGSHSEADAQGPVAKFDFGHLYTDYIGVIVSGAGPDEYPPMVNVTVGGAQMVLATSELYGTVVVDDAQGLKDAIQAAIDAEPVMPGNVTIPINFTVGRTTMSKISVADLRIDHDVPENAPPVWSGPASVSVAEDSQWKDVLTLETAFTDDYNPDDLRFSIVSNSDEGNLSTKFNAMPNGTHTLAVKPAPNFFGEVTLVLGAKDLFDAMGESQPLAVNVTQVGDPPVLEAPPLQLDAEEEAPFSYQLVFSDLDLPDDELTFSDNSDLLDVDPDTGLIEWTPAEDEVGEHTFVVTVVDRFGLQDSVSVRINVTNINDPPVIRSDLEVEVVQDSPYTYTILVDDPDLPFGDSILYYAYSEDIELDVNEATGTVRFTPRNEHYPGFDITIIVQDEATVEAEATVHVTVVNVNDPPVLDDVGTQMVDEDDEVSVKLVYADVDTLIPLEVPEALTLTSDGPEWLKPNDEGWIRFTAEQSMVGEYIVTYTITDREGLSDSITVRWVVRNVNDVPVITTPVGASVTAPEDAKFSLPFGATDEDGDTLTWSDDTALFAIVPSTGLVEFTPRQPQVGVYTVTISVTDGKGGITSVTFQLVVENVNDAPVIKSVVPINGTIFKEGEQVTFQAVATDEDGDSLTYRWMEGTKELGAGTPLAGPRLKPGQHTIKLVVSDGVNETEQTLSLEVEAAAEEGMSVAAVGGIAAIVIIVAVVAAVLFLRARRPAPPPEPPQAAEAPPEPEVNEDGTPKIEIEERMA